MQQALAKVFEILNDRNHSILLH